jgi:1,4-alpha-glucan branching enzyme
MPIARFELVHPGAERVYLTGDFNNWDPQGRRMKRMSRDSAVFVALVDLEPGPHEYKYVVDDEWICCPQAPRVPNSCGTENSVVEVGGGPE